MADLVPASDVVAVGVQDHQRPVGAATFWQALDASSASYAEVWHNDNFILVGMGPSDLDADQYATVLLDLDTRTPAGFSLQTLLVEGYTIGLGPRFGAKLLWSYNNAEPSTSFRPLPTSGIATYSKAELDAMRVQITPQNSGTAAVADLNDLRITIATRYDPAETTVLGPTGALVDNTPTVQWSTVINAGAEQSWRVKIFAEAVYTIGGFDPNTFGAIYDSGPRAQPGVRAFTIPLNLPAGAYRAYVATTQLVGPAPTVQSPHSQASQPETFASFAAFTVIPAAPIVAGPAIPTDIVADLSFAQARVLREPHAPVTRVRLFLWDGTPVRDLSVTTGQVSMDSGAQVRSKLRMTVTDLDLVPKKRSDAINDATPLHPFGSYVHVARGFVIDRFTTVLVGVGTFRLDKVTPKRDGSVQVTGSDFAGHLLDARVGFPITRQDWDTVPPTPFLVTDTAKAIIAEAGLAYDVPTANATRVGINYVNDRGDERPDALDTLAGTIAGWTWYATPAGVIYFGPGPDYANDEAAYELGTFTGWVMDDSANSLDRSQVYDVVIASDQAGTIVGAAYDRNPDSPIHRSAAAPAALIAGAGPFAPGGKPYFFAAPLFTDTASAEAGARTRLANVALPAETMTASGPPIPDLRPDKIVVMARPNDTVTARWQVTQVTMPLDTDQHMTIVGSIPTTDVDPATS